MTSSVQFVIGPICCGYVPFRPLERLSQQLSDRGCVEGRTRPIVGSPSNIHCEKIASEKIASVGIKLQSLRTKYYEASVLPLS